MQAGMGPFSITTERLVLREFRDEDQAAGYSFASDPEVTKHTSCHSSNFNTGEASVKQKFKARLIAKGPGGAWTYLPIPFDVYQALGSKSRFSVAGTFNEFPFRNSLMPEGDGTHSMMVSKNFRLVRTHEPGISYPLHSNPTPRSEAFWCYGNSKKRSWKTNGQPQRSKR
jgi:hypothetical protein